MITKTYSGVAITISEDDLLKKGVVYKFTYPNNKVYIGITANDIRRRIVMHCIRSKKCLKKSYNSKHYNAMNKYKEALVEVLYQGGDIQSKEIEYIKLYDSVANGYNSTFGGEVNNPSDEVLAKISKSVLEYNFKKGVEYKGYKTYRGKAVCRPKRNKYTDEERKERQCKWFIGKEPWNKGKPALPHIKEMLQTINIGRTPCNKGVKLSEERKAELKAKRKTPKVSKGSFEIMCYNLDGSFVQMFTKYCDAAKFLKTTKESAVRDCCRGVRHSFKNYIFRFKNESQKVA